MQANDLNKIAAAQPGAQALQRAEENEANADFENFLQLLTTQLRNQDPLAPLDSTEFVAQLASFSTVEQLVNANNRLADISSSLVSDALDRYAPWIGKEAEIADGRLAHDGGGFRFRAPVMGEASRVEIVISDAAGVEAARFAIDNDGAVRIAPNTLPAGQYKVKAVYSLDGETLAVEPARLYSTIASVSVMGDKTVLTLDTGVEVPPESIVGLGMVQ